MTTPQPTPGWYPTADGRHHRYHDGTDWTDHVHPVEPASATAPQKSTAFIPLWLMCSGAMTMVLFTSAAASDEGLFDSSDIAFALGRLIGTLVVAFAFGALVAWPIWWLANRNRAV